MCFFLILLFLSPGFAAPAEPIALATQRYTSASKEAHRARMAALLTVATAHVAAGLAPPEDVLAAQFFLEEADGWLKK